MKQASLFSGIGGFDLAAQWIGWENEFHCENNEFGKKILKYYWPKAISYDDITQTNFTVHRGSIDVLTGGFPCQPFSVSGKRGGTKDDRYLWPEMRRAYNEIRPNWLVCENVTGLLTMEDTRGFSGDVFFKVEGRTITRLQEVDDYEAVYVRQAKMLIESICEDFEKDGYEVFPVVIPAAGVQAPHRRDRLWIIAYSNSDGLDGPQDGQGRNKGNDSNKTGEETTKQSSRCGSKTDASYPNEPRLQGGERPRTYEERNGKEAFRSVAQLFEVPTWANFPTQPPVCSGDDGLPNGLDGITVSKWRQESIRAYGNAIVPQIAYEIFKTIDNVHKSI